MKDVQFLLTMGITSMIVALIGAKNKNYTVFTLCMSFFFLLVAIWVLGRL